MRRHNEFAKEARLHRVENPPAFIVPDDSSEFTPEQEQLAEKAMLEAFNRLKRQAERG